MPLLTAAEIAGMREDVEGTQLDMVCSILRPAADGEDEYGHPVTTLEPYLEDVPCHYWEASENEIQGGVNVTISREHIVLPAGTDVTNKDRIDEVTAYDGTVIGPMAILEVLKRINHVELIVEGTAP